MKRSVERFLRHVRNLGGSRPVVRRRCVMDNLEDRTLLSLVGVPLQFPVLAFNNTGTMNYDAANQQLSINADPLALRLNAVTARAISGARDFLLNVKVDNSGNLISGVAGHDLEVLGSIDIDGNGSIDFSGTLLTGEVTQFGWADVGAVDQYDFRFTVTGGFLASYYQTKDSGGNLTGTLDAGISMSSENSTFVGTFTQNFGGRAKGNLAPTLGLAKLGDFVWVDANGNGQQDSGESPLSGVSVKLTGAGFDGVFGTADDFTKTTTTSAGGTYLFDRLTAGNYKVEFANVPGMTRTFYNVGNDNTDSDADGTGLTNIYTLGFNETNLTVDAGYYQPASLGDRVWNDVDADGVQDDTETGVAGVEVTLTGAGVDGVFGTSDDTTTTQFTNASGNYLFENLAPGQYRVNFANVPGYTRSPSNQGDDALDSDADGSGNTGVYTLVSGQSNLTVDAGYYQPAALGDRVWSDTNANGVQDGGELGIEGVLVTLTGAGADGVFGTSDDTTATQFTNSSGNYLFQGLMPGSYKVNFAPVSGYVRTGANVGNDADDSDADASGNTGVYTLAAGQTDLSVDAGYYQPAALGDRVWSDTNANGVQDGGELGIEGVLVTLTGAGADGVFGTSDDTTATDTTDANGNYLFEGLTPGSYKVNFAPVSGYVRTGANVGNDADDSDADSSGNTGVYTLAAGQTDLSVDAGYYQPAALGDRVWSDTNANGVQDGGELGIEGVLVTLTGAGADGVFGTSDDTTATDTTDANGNYLFEGLTPGSYKVNFAPVSGYVRTGANVGNDADDSDADSSGNTGVYTLAAGQTDLSVDAGYYRLAALGDRVWDDADQDGVQDDMEFGIGGVLVTLTGAGADGVFGTGDDTTATDTTDDDGYYLFEGLMPGLYTVNFAAVSGFARTTADVGSDTADSDADANGDTGIYTLTAGQTDLSVDAGYYFTFNNVTASIDLTKYVKHVVTSSGGEGLTPGFWKTHSIYGPAPFKGWAETGYTANDSYEAIFGVNVTGTPTLYDALNANGGGINALMRHSTAALLNASHPTIEYAYTVAQVISMTKAAILSGNSTNIENTKNLFVVENERGADLNNSGGVNGDTGYGDDANSPTGPIVLVGEQVMFTYVVKNTGQVALGNITLVDDNASAGNTSDDFTPTAVMSGGFNVGDLDKDNLLDIGEEWLYTAISTVTAGQHMNTAVVTGSSVATNPVIVTDSDVAHWFGEAEVQLGSISGTKYRDVTGNGFSSDDTGLGGVTIKLYFDANNNGQLDSGDGNAIATTVTSANGNYTFNDVAEGRYFVKEVVASGWVRTGPALSEYYTVNVGEGTVSTGNNFANFQKCDCFDVTDWYYVINGCEIVDDLTGRVDAGDQVKVVFTVPSGESVHLTLVSYTAPDAVFVAENAYLQEIFDVKSGVFGPGTHSMTVQVPNGNFQIDFVCGPAIDRFGPAGSNIFYTPQGRLIDADNGGGNTAPTGKASLSGYVFDDLDNDGVKDSNEKGIAGATVKLTGTTSSGKSVSLTRTTDSSGYYDFLGLSSGTYTVTETQPDGYLDGKDSKGTAGGTLSNDKVSSISLSSTTKATGYNFGEIKASSLSGFVYEDADNDGVIDSTEYAIAGVTVKLTGTDINGQSVSRTTTTNSEGFYEFDDLMAGTYRITETQPSGYGDGKDSVGNLGGSSSTNDVFDAIKVARGVVGLNYNFGEVRTTGTLNAGMTATIGFWNNKNGQALIKSLDGGQNAKELGCWLADNFPALFGSKAAVNLSGKTNAQIAAHFQTLFQQKGQKLEAQILATALATYVTDYDLAGNVAKAYGFIVNSAGTGAATYNVGSNGSAFGVANNTVLTIRKILDAANNNVVNKKLWGGNSTLMNLANSVFDGINNQGDIV